MSHTWSSCSERNPPTPLVRGATVDFATHIAVPTAQSFPACDRPTDGTLAQHETPGLRENGKGDLAAGGLEEWRLLDLSFGDPHMNLAVEEAVLRAVGAGESPPTLRLWQNENAVVIGYSQHAGDEADLEFCRRNGTAVVRRISGGGAVYHDLDNLNYALFIPLSDHRVSADVVESFEYLSRGALEAIRILGFEGEFRPGNDITIGGRKVSGTAQARRGGAVLHHGTLLLDVNVPVMQRALRVRPEYLASKGATSVGEWVTSLRALGKRCTMEEVKNALVRGFERALRVYFTVGGLTGAETAMAERLAREQYRQPEWNFMR
ncbi:MAG: lipoate--protein ligase family protein [Chloroflexi bacterium]|nr:lipoate--protein ligase family protein [Chloroflexota bacterium]